MSRFELNHFDEFIDIAKAESEPQKLIMVIARRELPKGHTEQQARAFDEGHGGHLAPLAGVDKNPTELKDFSEFEQEAEQACGPWDAVFVAALPGLQGQPPTAKATDEAIEKVVHAIRNGMINDFLVFDRAGRPMQLSHG